MSGRDSKARLFAITDHHGQVIHVRAKTKREAVVRIALATKWRDEREVECVAYWGVHDCGADEVARL